MIENASSDVLIAAAKKGGMKRLLEQGMDKIYKGVTTLDEVERVLMSAQE